MKSERAQYRSSPHIPQRTCVACLTTRPKRELVRVVHTGCGIVEVDPSGKRAGRGAYLCPAKSCWEAAMRKERLSRALRTEIASENKVELLEFSKRFPQFLPDGPAKGELGGR